MMKSRSLLAGLTMLAACAWSAAAEWPEKQITLVVPFAAGGTNDILSRIIAENMSKTLGKPFVIENEPGAAGTIPAARIAKAMPDGYTIIMGNMGTHGIAPSQYPNLRYDPIADFTPIGLTGEVPAVVVARKNFPANTLAEFVAYVRKNQDKVSEAHVGVGSPTHTFCTLFQSLMEHRRPGFLTGGARKPWAIWSVDKLISAAFLSAARYLKSRAVRSRQSS